jgi:hypothetical protein
MFICLYLEHLHSVVGGYFGLHTAVIAHYLNKSQIPFGFGMINAANGIAIVTGIPLAGKTYIKFIQVYYYG